MTGTTDSSQPACHRPAKPREVFWTVRRAARHSDSFAPGRLYVVVGDNGAGKSTLLRVIAGLMQPSQGSVTLLGAKTVREVAHRIGYMGHAPLLYDELSGMENLRYFAGLYGLRGRRQLQQRHAAGRTRSRARTPRGTVLAGNAPAPVAGPRRAA